MSDLVERYIDTLSTRLARKLPKEVVEEHAREVRAHLAESIATLEAEGNSDPEITALKRIGPDKLLAENLIRVRKGLDSRPAWRFVVLPTILLIVYCVFVQSLSVSDHFWLALAPYLTLLPIAILALFFIGIVRSRRLLIKPIACSFAIFIVLFLGIEIGWGQLGVSDYSARRRADTIAGFHSRIAKLQKDIQVGNSVNQDAPFPAELRQGNDYLAPTSYTVQDIHSHYGIVSVKQRPRDVSVLREVQTEAQARSEWNQHGQAYFAYTEKELEEQQGLVKVWSERKATPLLFLTMAKNTALSSVPILAGIVAIGAALLGLVSLRSRLMMAWWKPERLT